MNYFPVSFINLWNYILPKHLNIVRLPILNNAEYFENNLAFRGVSKGLGEALELQYKNFGIDASYIPNSLELHFEDVNTEQNIESFIYASGSIRVRSTEQLQFVCNQQKLYRLVAESFYGWENSKYISLIYPQHSGHYHFVPETRHPMFALIFYGIEKELVDSIHSIGKVYPNFTGLYEWENLTYTINFTVQDYQDFEKYVMFVQLTKLLNIDIFSLDLQACFNVREYLYQYVQENL